MYKELLSIRNQIKDGKKKSMLYSVVQSQI